MPNSHPLFKRRHAPYDEPGAQSGGSHKWKCRNCPFETSDPDAKRGHEEYLATHPRGWLGRGETHTMVETE
jgi:hypothetical protein